MAVKVNTISIFARVTVSINREWATDILARNSTTIMMIPSYLDKVLHPVDLSDLLIQTIGNVLL